MADKKKFPPGLWHVRGYLQGGNVVQCFNHGIQTGVPLAIEGVTNLIPVCRVCLEAETCEIQPAKPIVQIIEDRITCSFCDKDPDYNCPDCGAMVCGDHKPCPDCKPVLPAGVDDITKLRNWLRSRNGEAGA